MEKIGPQCHLELLADEMGSGEEVSCGLFVAGCDASEVLDDVEEPLDQIAFGVESEIAISLGRGIMAQPPQGQRNERGPAIHTFH